MINIGATGAAGVLVLLLVAVFVVITNTLY